MKQTFIEKNPFLVLGVSPRTKVADIAKAFEEALTRHPEREVELIEARNTLTHPKKRLQVELLWFSDVAPSRVKAILHELSEITTPESILSLHDELSGLSFANIASHACLKGIVDTNYELLTLIFDTQIDINTNYLKQTINANRQVAGLPDLQEDVLEFELNKIREIHAEATLEGIKSTEHPGETMTVLVELYLDEDDVYRKFLEMVVPRYESWCLPETKKIIEELDKAVVTLRENPDSTAALKHISAKLAEWDEYNQPLQLLNEAKGLDEPESKRIAEKLRSAAIWLTNEQGNHSAALGISKALLKTFPELPSFVDLFEEDVEILEEHVSRKKFDEVLVGLVQAVQDAEEDLEAFNKEVLEAYFEPKGKGIAGRLYTEFVRSAVKLIDTDSPLEPWFAVRYLALKLANEYSHHEAASRITLKMIRIAEIIYQKRPDAIDKLESTLEQIAQDQRVCEINFKSGQLREALQGEYIAEAQLLTDHLINLTDDPDDRAKLQSLKKELKWNEYKVLLKWLAIPVVFLLFIVIGNINKDKTKAPTQTRSLPGSERSSSSNYDWSPRASTPRVGAQYAYVDQPPTGTDHSLTLAQLRYCFFENSRIEYLQPLLDEYDQVQVQRFNNRVREYNACCSQFQYYQRDRSVVEKEVASSRVSLQKEARLIADVWKGVRSVPRNQGLLSKGVILLDPTRSADARIIQKRLAERGFYKASTDGIWGKGSRMALKNFRQNNNIGTYYSWDRKTQMVLFRGTEQ